MAKNREEREAAEKVKFLLENFSLQELAEMVVKTEAGNDLLGRLAEEVGDKLQEQNTRIAELETENVLLRAHSTLKIDLPAAEDEGS
jgi:HPt (histidine-containing phosphotransfer) domain-containing protein